MTYTETMRQGSATVRRTSAKNIMRVLIEIIEADPSADNERRFQRWSEIIRDDEDYLTAALRHVFTNLNSALEKHHTSSTSKPRPRSRPEVAEAVNQMKEKIRTIILLDWVLPNGKALRYCTGRECKEMSVQVGGWLRKIADRVKPTQLVGSVLEETEVRKLYGK